MTYRELLYKATRLCDKGEITLGEYEEMTKPLDREVEQEPKTGHWVKYGSPRCGEQHYKCTSCGYYINLGQWGEVYTKQFKFCPNCGCRMAKGRNKE